jgi:hypothetical protein
MRKRLSSLLLRGALLGLMICALAFPTDIFGQSAQQDHIVNSQAMQQRLEASSSARQRNIDTLNTLLSSPVAEQAMQEAHVTPSQVKTAIPTLSDEELSNLATRAADAQMKFAAGSMSNHDMLLIILVLVIVIVVVAIVH